MAFEIRRLFIAPEYAEIVAAAERLSAEFAETARAVDESGEYPYENVRKMTEAGLMSLAVPSEYGGPGTEAGFCAWLPHLVVQTIAKGCGSTAWCLLTQYHACGQLAGLGTEEQKRRIFADVIENGARIATLGSEIQPQQAKAEVKKVSAGRSMWDAGGLVPTEEGFRATAFKGFTSTAAAADHIIFWSMAPGTQEQGEGLTLTIVPADREGITFLPGWEEAIGIRSSLSGPAKFNEMLIEYDEIMGQPGDWVQKHPYTHDLTYAMFLLGLAEGAYEFVLKVLEDRPYLQEEGSFMFRAGNSSSMLQATWASCKAAQEMYDQKQYGDAHHASLRALHQAKDTAAKVIADAFEIVGTRALLKFNPLERYWRDARTASSHTREAWHMSMIARGDLTDERFQKEKYGERMETRRTWKDLLPEYADQLPA